MKSLLIVLLLVSTNVLAQRKDVRSFERYIKALYKELDLKAKKVDFKHFRAGVIGYYNIQGNAEGFDLPYGQHPEDLEYDKQLSVMGKEKIKLKQNLILVNFDLHSDENRMLMIDMKNKVVEYHTQTSHAYRSEFPPKSELKRMPSFGIIEDSSEEIDFIQIPTGNEWVTQEEADMELLKRIAQYNQAQEKPNKVKKEKKIKEKESVKGYAQAFSNEPNSGYSSLGFMLTLNSYDGSFGYSGRLHGIDGELNNNVYKRDIVFHPGSAGQNTAGCFTYDRQEFDNDIVDFAKEGSILFAYYSKNDELKKSQYLNRKTAAIAKKKIDAERCDITFFVAGESYTEESPEYSHIWGLMLVVAQDHVVTFDYKDIPNDSCSIGFSVNDTHFYRCDSGLHSIRGEGKKAVIKNYTGQEWNDILDEVLLEREKACRQFN